MEISRTRSTAGAVVVIFEVKKRALNTFVIVGYGASHSAYSTAKQQKRLSRFVVGTKGLTKRFHHRISHLRGSDLGRAFTVNICRAQA